MIPLVAMTIGLSQFNLQTFTYLGVKLRLLYSDYSSKNNELVNNQ